MNNYTILTLNIHKGFSIANRRFTLENIRQCLRKSGANIVFLQEVVGENHELRRSISAWPENNQLEYLADSVWKHHAYGKNAIYQHGHHGNAILSATPFRRWSNLDISCLRFSQRGVLHGVSMDNLHLLCVHLGLFAGERRQQLKRLIDYVEAEIPAHEPMIIAGDFNDWTRQCHAFISGRLNLIEAHEVLNRNLARTYPVRFPVLAMDRIYLRGFDVESCTRLNGADWKKVSDHVGLLAELKLQVKK